MKCCCIIIKMIIIIIHLILIVNANIMHSHLQHNTLRWHAVVFLRSFFGSRVHVFGEERLCVCLVRCRDVVGPRAVVEACGAFHVASRSRLAARCPLVDGTDNRANFERCCAFNFCAEHKRSFLIAVYVVDVFIVCQPNVYASW